MRQRTRPSTFFTGAVVLSLAVALPGKTSTTVGVSETLSVESAHPYAATADRSAPQWTISRPGATYVRIHFGRFDLAPGDTLTVSSPEGVQSFSYEASGPFGDGEFWSNTVFGDTAVVTLNASVGGSYGFAVDRIGRGNAAAAGAVDSVCGATDWQDVECYAGGPLQDEAAHALSAVDLMIGCCTMCSGFKVSDSGQYLTAHGCLSTNKELKDTEIRARVHASFCNGSMRADLDRVLPKRILASNVALNYTLLLAEDEPTGLVRCVQPDTRAVAVGEPIYVAHLPDSDFIKVSVESDVEADGRCRVQEAGGSGGVPGWAIGYLCDTGAASVGAPVLSSATQTVVGLHYADGCPNVATRMDLIVADIGRKLDPCTPVPASCGNGAVDDPDEECDGVDLAGESCYALGYNAGGLLTCEADCTFNTSQCFRECVVQAGACDCNGRCSARERRSGACADCDPLPTR